MLSVSALWRHIDDQGLLAQARDGLEFETVFLALEGLLDAPARVVEVVEIAEQGGREASAVEVGGQHADLAVGRGLTDPAHARRARWTVTRPDRPCSHRTAGVRRVHCQPQRRMPFGRQPHGHRQRGLVLHLFGAVAGQAPGRLVAVEPVGLRLQARQGHRGIVLVGRQQRLAQLVGDGVADPGGRGHDDHQCQAVLAAGGRWCRDCQPGQRLWPVPCASAPVRQGPATGQAASTGHKHGPQARPPGSRAVC